MTPQEERFRKLTQQRKQNLSDAQTREEERLNFLVKGRAILYPVVKEVCEELASSLGFSIAQEESTSTPWYRRRKKLEGWYNIRFTQGKVIYTINVRALPPATIEVRVSPWCNSGSDYIRAAAHNLGTTIGPSEIGKPPDAAKASEALARALEKATTPYVENWD